MSIGWNKESASERASEWTRDTEYTNEHQPIVSLSFSQYDLGDWIELYRLFDSIVFILVDYSSHISDNRLDLSISSQFDQLALDMFRFGCSGITLPIGISHPSSYIHIHWPNTSSWTQNRLTKWVLSLTQSHKYTHTYKDTVLTCVQCSACLGHTKTRHFENVVGWWWKYSDTTQPVTGVN